uniref:ORF59 protein n=1 Tax=Plutella xylostella granulovirus TaxID=98383 RepID=A0A7U3W5I1_9BBAC|nr:ORF59 protein [Plutella xylostella granulovirus]
MSQEIVPVFNKWEETLVSSLNNRDVRHLQCLVQYNTLNKCLNFMKECLPISVLTELITYDDNNKMVVDDKLVCEKKSSKQKIMYNIGHRIKGGILNFYMWDRCVVRVCEGGFGNFLSIKGDNYPVIKVHLQKLMGKKFNEDMILINNYKVFSVPEKEEVDGRRYMMQKFFVAENVNNATNASSDKCIEPTTLSPMSDEMFDALFKIERGKKFGQDITFVVGSIIKGVEEAKRDSEITTFNCSNVLVDNVYTMNIVPEMFIFFE